MVGDPCRTIRPSRNLLLRWETRQRHVSRRSAPKDASGAAVILPESYAHRINMASRRNAKGGAIDKLGDCRYTTQTIKRLGPARPAAATALGDPFAGLPDRILRHIQCARHSRVGDGCRSRRRRPDFREILLGLPGHDDPKRTQLFRLAELQRPGLALRHRDRLAAGGDHGALFARPRRGKFHSLAGLNGHSPAARPPLAR